MSNEWVETLRACGIANDTSGSEIADNTDATTGDSVQLVDLSALRIVEITGEDASGFLQGQFCNDLKQVSVTHAQITGYCTPKGRLLALPTIVGFESGYRLLIPNDVADNFLKRLRMFVMRSDVTVTELEDWVCVGVIADEQGQLGMAAGHLGGLPASQMDAATGEARQVIRWHDDFSTGIASGTPQTGRHRYITLASVADQVALWNDSDDASKRPNQTWRLGDVSSGVPTVTTGVVETFVPQMVNLQLIDALSFTKGCYPGQEIVARMQYLGKLKRHMRLFFAPEEAGLEIAPRAGETLSTADDSDAGVVMDAVHNVGKGVLILAVAKVSANQSVFSSGDAQLLAVNLPYPLPSLDVPRTDAG